MKKTTVLCAILSLAFSSCYHSNESSVLGDESVVTFNLVADGLSQSSLTRADDAPALDNPTNILVLDSFDGEVKATTFSSLSSVVLPLKYGLHNLYFVAAPVAWSAYSTTNLTATWANDGTMKAVWGYYYQIEVDETTTFEDIILPLVVADVRIKTLDIISSGAVAAKFEAPDISTILDLSTMKAAQTANGLDRKLNISAAAGKSKFVSNNYTFVPSSGKVGDIKLAFYSDTDCNTEIVSRTFDGVPVSEGYVTSYEGYFFTDGISIPLTHTTSWLGTNVQSY